MLPCTDQQLQHLADSPPAVGEPPVLVPGIVYARLDNATSQDDTIPGDAAAAPCLGGSMVRELLEKLPVVGKNSSAEGWRIYRCLVDTVITDPISRGSPPVGRGRKLVFATRVPCTVFPVSQRSETLGNARKRFENLPAELFSRRLRNAKFSLPNPGLYGGDTTRVQVLLPSRTFPPLF